MWNVTGSADRRYGPCRRKVREFSGRCSFEVDLTLGNGTRVPRDVGHAGSQTGSDGVHYKLDRRWCMVLPNKDLGMVGVEQSDVLVGHLLHRAIEAGQLRPAVRAAHPGVGGPELELGNLVLTLDGVEGGEQARRPRRCGAGVRCS